MYKPKLLPTTKLAFQAMTAVFLAALLAPLFHWERSYWSVLTAMLMISQTLGDSIKKSVERVSMTIGGGLVGTLLFFMTEPWPHLQMALLLLSLFFCIFFLNAFYLWSVFFVSTLVVFIFAIVQNWTFELLFWRIIETLFGASMAILAATFVFPVRTSKVMEQDIITFIKHLSSLTLTAIQQMTTHSQNILALGAEQQALLGELNQLQQKLVSIRFELIFQKQKRRHLRHELSALTRWYDLLSSWVEQLKHEDLRIPFYKENIIEQIRTIIAHNIKRIETNSQARLDDLSPLIHFIRCDIKRALKQKRIQISHAYRTYHHLHTLNEINQVCKRLHAERYIHSNNT